LLDQELQTAAIAMGGTSPNARNEVEQWNGSAWTEVSELVTGTAQDLAGSGTSTSTLMYGGDTPGSPG
jgi:hypothetical protein